MGHVTIDHNGIGCNCGGRGCLEAYASTSALVQQYAALTRKNPETVDGHYIVDRFKENEPEAVKCMEEHTDYLGHGIAGLVNIFSPQRVVIGGGISEAGDFYIASVDQAFRKYVMPDCAVNTTICAAVLGNRAGMMGAARWVFMKTVLS